MKKNGECVIGYCGECPDIEINYGKGYRCRKLNVTKEFSEDLFSICHLPELKEIRVWFEKRPYDAKLFDVCVFQDVGLWVIENMEWRHAWGIVAAFEKKAAAEAFLGCKIPEEVNPKIRIQEIIPDRKLHLIQ